MNYVIEFLTGLTLNDYLMILAMGMVVTGVALGLNQKLKNTRGVGYCDSNDDCAQGWKCVNNLCTKIY